ncbi:MAG TPA: DUF2252 domain-containing protein [Acidimicrobiales bacterium]|nr:DUF2252 domain-containing protein [Acidimicrobiales bacterium]
MPETARDRERRIGRRRRAVVPRTSHGVWEPGRHRPDPIALLDAENDGRLAHLVPVRWGRMLESPFAFLRGAAGLMAADLARTASTGLHVQLCGDAHMANFGVFASPERRLLFDVNDFDETTPGPWEWDLKRLATSAVVIGRVAGIEPEAQAEAAHAAARAYRRHMARFAVMGRLDVWYERVDAKAALRTIGRRTPAPVRSALAGAHHQTSRAELPKLTVRTDEGQRRIVDHPPLVSHEGVDQHSEAVSGALAEYPATLESDRRTLLERFELVDLASKVVGVGSVGTRCFVALFMSDLGDPLFLQVKEAGRSLVAASVPRRPAPTAAARGTRPPTPESPRVGGRRVVGGQRLMQAASDIFLGWASAGETDFYIRQLRDMKGTVDTTSLRARGLVSYAKLCGWALARAHARSGTAAQIAGYAGNGGVLDDAISRFAVGYADQTEQDYALLLEAVRSGRVMATPGL